MMTNAKYLIRRVHTEDGDMFGIFRNGEETPIYKTFHTKYAKIIIELQGLADNDIVDKESIRENIMKTIGMDRGQRNGKLINKR